VRAPGAEIGGRNQPVAQCRTAATRGVGNRSSRLWYTFAVTTYLKGPRVSAGLSPTASFNRCDIVPKADAKCGAGLGEGEEGVAAVATEMAAGTA